MQLGIFGVTLGCRVLCSIIGVVPIRAQRRRRRRFYRTSIAIQLYYGIWVVFQLVLVLQPIEGVRFKLTRLARTHRVPHSGGFRIVFGHRGPIMILIDDWRSRGSERIGRRRRLP
jgi:hypothetical protein